MLFTGWELLQREDLLGNLSTHKHITVNGNLVNIPSFSVKEGDMVAVKRKI